MRNGVGENWITCAPNLYERQLRGCCRNDRPIINKIFNFSGPIRMKMKHSVLSKVVGYRNRKNTKRGTTAAIEEGVHDVFKLRLPAVP